MTEVRKVSFNQDRTGIVFDYIGDTFLERHLGELFRNNENRYVYLKDTDFDAKKLFEDNKEKIDNGELIAAEGGKIVFCHYLKIENLNKEWVERFLKQAAIMREYVPCGFSSDQHHLICIRVRAMEVPNDQKATLADLIYRLGTECNDISKQVYIIREEGWQPNQISKQEYGIAQMFHLCSIEGHERLAPIHSQSTCGIHLVKYTDFYENQQREYQDRITNLKEWFSSSKDKDQTELIKALSEICKRIIVNLRSEEQRIGLNDGVYPVRITEYSGNWLFGYKRNDSYVKKRLASLREGARENKVTEIVNSEDFSSAISVLDDYCLNDLLALKEKTEETDVNKQDNTLKTLLQNEADKNNKAKDVIDAVYARFLEEISGRIVNIDEQKKQKDNEKKKLIVLSSAAGKFDNLEDCLKKVNNTTSLQSFKGTPLSCPFSVCLVNGDFVDEREVGDIEIEDVDAAYVYPPIAPLQVAMLKVYHYYGFNIMENEMDLDFEKRSREAIIRLF